MHSTKTAHESQTPQRSATEQHDALEHRCGVVPTRSRSSLWTSLKSPVLAMLLLYSKNVCSMLSATCSRAAAEDHNAQQRGRQGLVPPAWLQQAALADAAGRGSQRRACTLQQPPREGSSQAATSGALPAFGLQLASGCPARPAAWFGAPPERSGPGPPTVPARWPACLDCSSPAAAA